MATTPKRLVHGIVPDTLTTAYSAPALTSTIILSLVFHNTTSGSETVEIFLTPSGGSDFKVVEQSINANGTYFFNERVILDPSDSIKIRASTAASIDYLFSGVEVT